MVRTHPQSKALKPTLTAGCGLNGASGNANPRGPSNAARERQEGTGRGDTVRLRMGGILRGVGKHRENGGDTWQQGQPAGNAMNPTIGSGMQQARDSQRNRQQWRVRGSPGDGVNGGANRRGGAKPRGRNMVRIWSIRARRGDGDIDSGVDAGEHVDGGAEGHGRASGRQ